MYRTTCVLQHYVLVVLFAVNICLAKTLVPWRPSTRKALGWYVLTAEAKLLTIPGGFKVKRIVTNLQFITIDRTSRFLLFLLRQQRILKNNPEMLTFIRLLHIIYFFNILYLVKNNFHGHCCKNCMGYCPKTENVSIFEWTESLKSLILSGELILINQLNA